MGITEPKIILKKLIEARQIESNTTKTTAKQKLYNMKKNKNQTAIEFCDKFDEALKELDVCNPETSTSEDEIKSIFYHAVKNTSPVLVSTRMVRNQTGTDMTYEEMKNCILQTDAEQVNINFDMTPEATASANAAARAKRLEIQRRRENTCNRCNRGGHWMADCPWKGTDKWFCYKCNGDRNHSQRHCPEKIQRYDRQNNYKNRGRGINRGMSRGGGRGGRGERGSRGNHRYHPYNGKNNKNNGGNNQNNTRAKQAGETDLTYNTTRNISFIADSGATEHIIKKGLILRDYISSEGEEIRSANSNKKANIKIDGRGNLYLSLHNSEKYIHLTNVIAASGISDNLLSLRKFADAGYGIYLDNDKLSIFDKETNEEYITGVYQKPNWAIKFSVQNEYETNKTCLNYTVRASLVSLEDFLSQSQKDDLSSILENPNPSEIGREKRQEKEVKVNVKEENEPELITFPELNRKTLDLNNIIPEIEAENLIKYNKKNSSEENRIKHTEGMLWHMRLGHPSLEYMRKMQKYEEKLKKVKLDKEILDCETCVLAKMEKLPFKNNRRRSDRPLHTIHTDTMGPITPTSFPGENKFIIVFIDDHSRYARTYHVKHKSQSGECLQKYLEHTRNLLGKQEKVCFIRSDNGTEFTGGHFAEIVRQEKIDSDYAPPYTPELNGKAERFIKTLQKKNQSVNDWVRPATKNVGTGCRSRSARIQPDTTQRDQLPNTTLNTKFREKQPPGRIKEIWKRSLYKSTIARE